MKLFLSLITLVSIIYASQLSEEEIANEVKDNISKEYLECAVVFMYDYKFKQHKNDEISAKKSKAEYEKVNSFSVNILKELGKTRIEAEKINLERVNNFTKEFIKETNGSNELKAKFLNEKLTYCRQIKNDESTVRKKWVVNILNKYKKRNTYKNNTTTDELIKRCNNDEFKYCHDLGLKLFNQENIDNKKKANKLFEKACNANIYESCLNLGKSYLFENKGVQKNTKKGLYLIKKSCDNNLVEACATIGQFYMKGKYLNKNINKGLSLMNKACKDGNYKSCHNLGIYYNKDFVELAEKYYAKACTNNIYESCYNLAIIHFKNKKIKESMQLFKKACNGEIYQSCAAYNKVKSLIQ